MSFDFNDFIVYDMEAAYVGASFDSYNYEGDYLGDGRQAEHVWTTYRPVAIGNDGVGGRSVPLGNLIDEVLVFNKAVTMDDLKKIDDHYGATAAMKAAKEDGKEIPVTISASNLCEILKEQFQGGYTFSGVTGSDVTWDEDGYVSKAAVKYVIKAAN